MLTKAVHQIKQEVYRRDHKRGDSGFFSPPGSGALPPPLDDLTPTGAWSASRQLLSSYTGVFYTLTSGAVSTLNDQSGNSRNLTQSTADRRPTIVSAGPNVRDAMDFDTLDIMRLQSAVSLDDFINNNSGYMVISFIADQFILNLANGAQNDWLLADSGLFAGMTVRAGGIAYSYNWDGNYDQPAQTGLVVGTPYVLEWRHEGGNIYCRLNGNLESSVASGNTTTMTNVLAMGSANASQGFDGKIFEAITFDTVPTLSVRNSIVDNFKNWIGA